MSAVEEELARLKAEYRQLVNSWEYAFAMGHGCSMGQDPHFWITRQRAADLRARIAELS